MAACVSPATRPSSDFDTSLEYKRRRCQTRLISYGKRLPRTCLLLRSSSASVQQRLASLLRSRCVVRRAESRVKNHKRGIETVASSLAVAAAQAPPTPSSVSPPRGFLQPTFCGKKKEDKNPTGKCLNESPRQILKCSTCLAYRTPPPAAPAPSSSRNLHFITGFAKSYYSFQGKPFIFPFFPSVIDGRARLLHVPVEN